MTIQYQSGKMSDLLTDEVLTECLSVATSSTGSLNDKWSHTWKNVFKDKFDLYMVLARDDAAANKLVGMFCFGDISQYEILIKDRKDWVDTMRAAIVSKGIEEAKVDAAAAIYVHADYTGQNIAKTMMGKRATYQLARGITHAVSFAYESTDIMNWSAGRTSAEEMGTDGDGNKIYFFDLDQLKM